MATEGLSSSVSGIRANADSLDFASNNLANVYTTGFKASHAGLTDGPGGQGASLASSSRDTGQGPVLLTGRAFDVAIEGEGFFSVRRPDGSLGFTRDGSFQVDGRGRVAAADGSLLDPAVTVPAGATDVRIDRDGRVTATVDGATQDAGRIAVTRFPNPGGLSAEGGNRFRPTAASGAGARSFPGEGGAGRLVPGALEGSTVDIATEIVHLMIGQRSVEANVAAVRTQDEMLGTVLDLKR